MIACIELQDLEEAKRMGQEEINKGNKGGYKK